MNYLIYIIIFVISLPIVYKGFQKLNYLRFNRNYLKNRNIEDKLKPFVIKALNKYDLGDFIPYQYTNINLEKKNKKALIQIELFILKKNKLIRWNPVEKLIKINGYKYQNGYVIEDLVEQNSIDIGYIIPANSNVPLNRLFRNRRWKDHKKYWDLYKKDWDIRWLDEPIY